LIVAPALRQSQENFRKILSFLEGMDERPSLVEDTKLSLTLDNKSRILSLPGGNEGRTIRGFSGPDLVVEDESARCSDELYGAIFPMLASNFRGRLILCSTPWGKRGHFYKIWTEESGWLKVEAIGPDNPRIDPGYLMEARKGLGDWLYRQEFLGEFVETEDQIFIRDLIEQMIDSQVQPLFRKQVMEQAARPGLVDKDVKPLSLEAGT
jgi:hypothetical protein